MDKRRMSHPRIFIDQKWVSSFPNDVKTHKELEKGWNKLIKEAEELLLEELIEESYADSEDSQHGRYNLPGEQIKKMGMTLGLAYQVTKDQRYADKLKGALLYFSRYQKWHGKGLADKNPPWHSELNTARFCFGFALGYDFIYKLLSEEEREEIREAVIQLGILPTLQDWVLSETRVHALDSMGHNWWIVCVSQAGLAVLSILDDDPRAERWLAQIHKAIPYYFSYQGSVLGNKSLNYDRKGAFYESVNYAQYAIYEYMLFRIAYSQINNDFSIKDIPILDKTADFFIQTFYPSTHRHLTVNFGDGHIHNPSTMGAKLFLVYGIGNPALRWYVQQYNEDYDAYDIIFHKDIKLGETTPPEQTSEFYEDIGWALYRDSWKTDATLLAVKSGFTWNHAHADAGSFMLFHKGQPILIDSGNCSYGRKEYNRYYCQSEAHNVVLFNEEGQEKGDIGRGGKEPGQLYHFLDHADLRYVYADVTGPTGKHFIRNFRHFLWVDNVILVLDDLLSYESGKMEWLLHYEGSMEQKAENQYMINNQGAKVIVQNLFPKNLVLQEKEGLAYHDPDIKVPYASFSPSQETKEAKFINAIIPINDDKSFAVPTLIPLEGNEMTGVRIINLDKKTDIYFNHRADGRIMHQNSYNIVNGWETDAYMLAITRSLDSSDHDFDTIERCFVSGGSFVRRDQKVLVSSLSKLTAAFTIANNQLQVVITGQPNIEAEIYCKQEPHKLIVNDSARDVNYNIQNNRVAFDVNTNLFTARRPG